MLKIGDAIPPVELKDQHGEIIKLDHLKNKYPLVIYFYPKDDTPGCTAEACSFRDRFEDFQELGAKVIGISGDSVPSHKKFAEKHRLNFTLLSDSKKQAEKAFGVPRDLFGLLPGRVTFVVEKGGKIVHTFNSALNTQKHIKEALKALSSN